VKIADEREARAEAVAALVQATGAEVAQTIGRTVLLFKKRKKKSKFEKLGQPAAEVITSTPKKPTKKVPGAKKALRNAAEALDDDADKPADAVYWYEEEVEDAE